MNRKYAIIGMIVAGLMLPNPVSAATVSWDDGGPDANWGTSLNWDPDGVPTAADDVFIGNLPMAANDLIFLDAHAAAGELHISNGADLMTNLFQLTVAGPTVLNGAVGMVALVVDAGGGTDFETDTLSVVNGAEFRLNNGAIQVNTGPFYIDAASLVNVNGGWIHGAGIRLDGQFDANDGHTIIDNSMFTARNGSFVNVISAVSPATLTISSNMFSVEMGSRIDIGGTMSAKMIIKNHVDFFPGSVIQVNSEGALQIDGSAVVADTADLRFTHDNTELVVNGLTVIDQDTFVWEGTGGTTTMVGPNATLTLDVDTLGTGNQFGGTLVLDSGTVGVATTAGAWELTSTSLLTMINTLGVAPIISGDELTLNGQVDVTGAAEIQASAAFESAANLSLSASSDELRLAGDATFDGGIYVGDGVISLAGNTDVIGDTNIKTGLRTEAFSDLDVNSATTLTLSGESLYAGGAGSHGGAGKIVQTGDATVLANTTINTSDVYDWDGASDSSATTVNEGVTFVVTGGQIDETDDVYNGTLQLDGGAVHVSTTSGAWEAAGTLNMHTNSNAFTSTVTGAADLNVSGAINVTGGDALIDVTNLTFEPTGVVNVSAGANLMLGDVGGTGGGNYRGGFMMTGAGTVTQNDSVNLGGGVILINLDPVTGVFDISGDNAGGNLVTIDFDGQVTINAGAIDDDAPGIHGVLDNRGALTVNTPGPWHVDPVGRLELTQTSSVEPTLNGSELVVDPAGLLYIQGMTHVTAPVSILGDLQVLTVSELNLESDTALDGAILTLATGTSYVNLRGPTEWRGGSYTGPGRIRQFGDADVTASTTINVGSYKWDGMGSPNASNTIVRSGATFALNVNAISTTNNYMGHVTVEDNAELAMNLPAGPWVLDGTATLQGVAVPTPTAIISGVELVLNTLGRLEGNGQVLNHVTSEGTVSPGASAGCIRIVGDYTQDAAGILEIELAGLAPINEHDQVNATGAVTLDGELQVSLLDSYVPNLGDMFVIVTGASRTGQFGTETGLEIDASKRFAVQYNPADVTLLVVDRADCDEDGDVDADDYASLEACLSGPGGGLSPGCECYDFDEDGDVDFEDVAEFQLSFTGP